MAFLSKWIVDHFAALRSFPILLLAVAFGGSDVGADVKSRDAPINICSSSSNPIARVQWWINEYAPKPPTSLLGLRDDENVDINVLRLLQISRNLHSSGRMDYQKFLALEAEKLHYISNEPGSFLSLIHI